MKNIIILIVIASTSACGKKIVNSFRFNSKNFNELQTKNLWEAKQIFNDMMGCDFIDFIETSSETKLNNNVSEFIFTENFINRAAGMTIQTQSETDILIRPYSEYIEIHGKVYKKTDFPNKQPSYVDTYLHELGHAFGLEHSEDITNLMHPLGILELKEETLIKFKEDLEYVGISCKTN